MAGVTVAKATKSDLESTLKFLNASELALDRPRYGFGSAYDQWEDLDDDDPDKIKILAIRKRLASEEECNEEQVDSRILMYEFLQKKFIAASCDWRRVYWAADLLIKSACDPTEDHLAFFPGFELNHVATEQ